MRDPTRLMKQGATDFERALLDSARLDVGSRRVQAKCAALVGAGTALSGKAAIASASGHTLELVTKWLGIGMVAGFSTTGALVVGARGTDAESITGPSFPDTSAVAVGAAPARVVHASPALSALPQSSPQATSEQSSSGSAPLREASLSATQTGNAKPAAAKEDGSKPGNAEPPMDTLDREVRLLDRARYALRRGDTAAALAALDQRDRAFPDGALAPETAVIRVQTLLAAGEQAAALAQARDFLREHPSGAHATRIRAALNSSRVESVITPGAQNR